MKPLKTEDSKEEKLKETQNSEDGHYEESEFQGTLKNNKDSQRKTKKKMDKRIDPNKLLETIGGRGRFQMLSYLLVQTLNFPYAAAMFVMTFIEQDPHKLCVSRDKSDVISEDQCQITRINGEAHSCDSYANSTLYLVNSGPVDSIYTSLNLLCSNSLFKEFGLTLFTIGAVVTVPFISMASDRFGRKITLLVCISISAISNMLTYFSDSTYSFFILRFIIGAASDGYLTIVTVLTSELVASEMRDWFGLIYNIAWSGGLLYTGLLSLFISDWRLFYLVSSVPIFFLFPVYAIWIPETLHWLCQHNKQLQINEYIEFTEKFNGESIDVSKCYLSEKRRLHNQTKKRHPWRHVWEALKDNTFRYQMLINGYIQFVIALFYFTVTLESTNLTSDSFLGFTLSAAIELPGGILTLPALKYFGRRTLVVSSLILQGILIAAYPFTPFLWLAVTFNLFSKIANGIVYTAHPLLLTEMIPTSMRTSMYSLVNIPQSLGIICAPYLKHLQFGTTYVMYIFLAVTSIIAGLLSFLLPETKGKRLPQQLNDLSNSETISKGLSDDKE